MNIINTKKSRYFLFLFLLMTIPALCDQVINVGVGGQNIFSTLTSPITLGEKITFNFISGGFHNVVSVNIPNGATSLASGSASSSARTYDYTPNVVGVYNFQCGVHGSSMPGSFTVTGVVTPSPVISTGKTDILSACENAVLSFPYTITGTMPTDGNYVVQLSNSSGSFTSPSILVASVDGIGNAVVTIPSNISTSSKYRLRLIYDSPTSSVIGSDNGEDLTLSSNPTPSISISSSANGSICSGSSVTVTSSNIGVQNVDSYQWVLNSAISTDTDYFSSNTLADSDDLILVTTVQAGGVGECPSFPAVLTSNGISFSVLEEVTPSVTIVGVDQFLDDCFGYTTFYVLSINSSGLGSSPVYKWFVNNSLSTVTSSSITISNEQVFVIAESSLSCVSITTVSSNIIQMPTTTELKMAYVEYQNNQLKFINSGLLVHSGNQFQWLLNDIPVLGATTNPYTPGQSGTYKCIVTFTGCVVTISGINNTDLTIIVVGTSTNTNELETEISIYPNPSNGKIFVAVNGIAKADLVTYVYDLDGRMRIQKTFEVGTCKGGKGKQCLCPGISEIDLSDLNPGSYIVFVTNGLQTLTRKKVLKQ